MKERIRPSSRTACYRMGREGSRVGDEVEVVGMAPEVECRHEMFVEMPWEHKRTLAIPLSQLKVVHGNRETTEAVEDWCYWLEMGYEF